MLIDLLDDRRQALVDVDELRRAFTFPQREELLLDGLLNFRGVGLRICSFARALVAQGHELPELRAVTYDECVVLYVGH